MSGKWASSDRASRLPPGWSKIRERIRKRDGYRCTWVEHGQRCTGPADEVDHNTPGDDHRDSNLRSLCSPHHKAKTQGEAMAARPKRRRDAEQHPGLMR